MDDQESKCNKGWKIAHTDNSEFNAKQTQNIAIRIKCIKDMGEKKYCQHDIKLSIKAGINILQMCFSY